MNSKHMQQFTGMHWQWVFLGFLCHSELRQQGLSQTCLGSKGSLEEKYRHLTSHNLSMSSNRKNGKSYIDHCRI